MSLDNYRSVKSQISVHDCETEYLGMMTREGSFQLQPSLKIDQDHFDKTSMKAIKSNFLQLKCILLKEPCEAENMIQIY